MYKKVPPKILTIAFRFHTCKIAVAPSAMTDGSPHGRDVNSMSLKQYTTRIAMIIGGIYFSIKVMMRGGSRYENSKNGKARVAKTMSADMPVAMSAAARVSGVIEMSPFRF